MRNWTVDEVPIGSSAALAVIAASAFVDEKDIVNTVGFNTQCA